MICGFCKFLLKKSLWKYVFLLVVLYIILFESSDYFSSSEIEFTPFTMRKSVTKNRSGTTRLRRIYDSYAIQCSIDNRLLEIQDHYIFSSEKTGFSPLLPSYVSDIPNDRIIEQMRYVPPRSKEKTKVIYLEEDSEEYISLSGCPVQNCRFTYQRSEASTADVVLYRSFSYLLFESSNPNQVRGFYMLESPQYFSFSETLGSVEKHMHWMASYHPDSTLVTPYFKVTPLDMREPVPSQYPPLPPSRIRQLTYIKKHNIAWYVSNCGSFNTRMQLAQAIATEMTVDIYGDCGTLQCEKRQDSCFKILEKYWFYLSFENSNCQHYITEKFFRNALNNSVLPIVMGARPDDYKLVAPPHSYIHVEDFNNVASLVMYLRYLQRNATAYAEYFAWQSHMHLDTNTFFWCRLCTMAHYLPALPSRLFPNLRNIWDVNKTCVNSAWTIKPYW